MKKRPAIREAFATLRKLGNYQRPTSFATVNKFPRDAYADHVKWYEPGRAPTTIPVEIIDACECGHPCGFVLVRALDCDEEMWFIQRFDDFKSKRARELAEALFAHEVRTRHG